MRKTSLSLFLQFQHYLVLFPSPQNTWKAIKSWKGYKENTPAFSTETSSPFKTMSNTFQCFFCPPFKHLLKLQPQDMQRLNIFYWYLLERSAQLITTVSVSSNLLSSKTIKPCSEINYVNNVFLTAAVIS